MKHLGLAYLAVFAAWAVGVVNTDLASKKIPNEKLALGAKLLLPALLLLAFNSYLGARGSVSSYLTWNFYLLWGAHLFWTAAAGIVLWYSEIWPAGDAKFFILVAAWLPLINPLLKNFPNYLFISLLMNIFISASLAAVGGFLAAGFYRAAPADYFREIFNDLKNRFAGLAGETADKKRLAAAYIASLTFIFLLQQILNAESRRLLGRFLVRADLIYFFLFFLWDKLSGSFRSKKWLYAVTAGYVVYFFAGYFYFYDRLAALVVSSLVNVFKFSLLLFLGRFMLEFLLEKKDTVYIGPGELETGMILSAKAARTLKANPAFEGAFEDCFKDGLSAEQAGLLRNWLGRLAVREPKIEIVLGRPFAVWIFAGAVISLLLDKNLIKLIGG